MANTTNFGWETPDDTDLVKDGAAAIRTLGSAIDASLADLEGGTTGQVLKKNSNTDMDFIWAADSAGMTNPMTTTGDTIYSSSGSTPARLAIGSTGNVLTVAGGVPTWAAPAAGGMTLINSGGTALTGSVVNISSIPSTYKNLQLWIVNHVPATDGSYLRVRINGETTNYSNETASGGTNTFGEPAFYVSNEQDNSQSGAIAVLDFYDYANTASWKLVRAWGFNPSATAPSTNYYTRGGNVAHSTTSAITELNISYFGGNMSSGTAYLYGVK